MTKVQKQLLKIHVEFTILTPDQLRKIIFGLDKDKSADGQSDVWKITFSLALRAKKTDAFVPLVSAVVNADTKDTPLAEATAQNGANKAQADHLILNVATAAERWNAGKIKQATFDRTLKATLPARNA